MHDPDYRSYDPLEAPDIEVYDGGKWRYAVLRAWHRIDGQWMAHVVISRPTEHGHGNFPDTVPADRVREVSATSEDSP